jgi:hypothetical protein
MDVFGRRAGADMAEAVRQGRFDVQKFMDVFNDKNGDNIKKAAACGILAFKKPVVSSR